MDLSVSDTGHPLVAERERNSLFVCDYGDMELVHKIAQALLSGLASACVDSTTGDLFRSPALIAVEMRKAMIDYLAERSAVFVAESVLEESNENVEVLDNPVEIMSILMDDFVSSKRNILGRVSSWLLSEKREEKIDDFEQEMEVKGFWPMDRRAALAGTLLKNVDYKNTYHCCMKFDTANALLEHQNKCNFRVLRCLNGGCCATFCAVHSEKHDLTCPFKVLPCEQKCPDTVLRREMDKHCITVCPMRLMNCPFYQVGCQSAFPRCTIKEHCSSFLHYHLLRVLHVLHKNEAEDDLRKRIEFLSKFPSFVQLSDAQDVRSFTWEVKDIEEEATKHETDLEKQ